MQHLHFAYPDLAKIIIKNKDKIKGKFSFIDLYGEQKAKTIAMNHISEAKDILSSYGRKGIYLSFLTDYILDRKK